MKVWIACVGAALLAGCASRHAVKVDCGRHLVPINVFPAGRIEHGSTTEPHARGAKAHRLPPDAPAGSGDGGMP
jgi:hypothetical protein